MQNKKYSFISHNLLISLRRCPLPIVGHAKGICGRLLPERALGLVPEVLRQFRFQGLVVVFEPVSAWVRVWVCVWLRRSPSGGRPPYRDGVREGKVAHLLRDGFVGWDGNSSRVDHRPGPSDCELIFHDRVRQFGYSLRVFAPRAAPQRWQKLTPEKRSEQQQGSTQTAFLPSAPVPTPPPYRLSLEEGIWEKINNVTGSASSLFHHHPPPYGGRREMLWPQRVSTPLPNKHRSRVVDHPFWGGGT